MNRKRTRQVTILKVSQNYYVVVPNDLIKLQSVIFAIIIYTGGAKDNGSNSDHGYSGNTAGLYWTSAVFADPDYEL